MKLEHQAAAPADDILWLRLRACDTLFFREMRSHGGPGGVVLESSFPPPARTLMGALLQVLYELCPDGGASSGPAFSNVLRLQGPYLHWQESAQTPTHGDAEAAGSYLCPWPLHLFQRQSDDQEEFCHLLVATQAQQTDLGRVWLPLRPAGRSREFGARAGAWLPALDYARLLHDPAHQPAQWFSADGGQDCVLFQREVRQGLARDPEAHAIENGALYSTAHIRPDPRLSFVAGLQLAGSSKNSKDSNPALDAARSALLALRQALQEQGSIVRLGGEGRPAYLDLLPAALHPERANPCLAPGIGMSVAPEFFCLHFLQHADFDGDWKPGNFHAHSIQLGGQQGQAWQGFLDAALGVEVQILSAACGKLVREGGWQDAGFVPDANLGSGQPRTARALLPAGSVWFCRVLRGDVRLLHGRHLGRGRELGRGQIAIGHWDGGPFCRPHNSN